MTIYAYRARLTLKPSVDASSQQFRTALENNSGKVRRQIALFGGDPLPQEQMLLRVTGNGVVILVWRSRVPPDREDLIESIREYAKNLTLIEKWSLYYHRCGNGVAKPCMPWNTLIEDET